MKTIPIVAAPEPTNDEPLREHELYDTPEKDVLVLNYTLACPLSCDFCCYGCHPNRKEKMPLVAAKKLVSQAAAMPNFSSIGLTGGEVFMFEEELISLAEHINHCGLPYTVATAAHWATSASTARELATKLVSNGLKRANISCDHSHTQFVSKQNVIHAAEAFAKLNVPVYIVGTFSDATSSLEQFIPELTGKEYIFLRTKRTAKAGRAKKAHVQYDDIQSPDVDKTCYRRVHHDVVVFWDGEVYPCCSTFNRSTKGLSIGNAFQTPLVEIWKRLEFSSLFRKMKSSGFSEIIGLLNSNHPSLAARLPKLGDYPGACSYCNSVFSDKDLTMQIRSFFADYETDALLSSQEELTKLLGEERVAQLFHQFSISATEGDLNACRS